MAKYEKKYDPKLRYNVFRSNQFISPFGVGSIVDLPDESVMPATIDEWPKSDMRKLYDPRLQRRLKKYNITHFRKVPTKSECRDGIPFYRFPKWLYCRNPKCGRLRHINTWREDYKKSKGKESRIPRCNICNLKLVPTRFIVICEKGHIDDFPWLEWVHDGKSCDNPDLRLKIGGSSSGLGGIIVECQGCRIKKSLKGAFSEGVHSRCSGYKPWEGNDCKEECDCKPITVQRTASNVYFPKTVSSILIPPYSNQLIADIQKTEAWTLMQTQRGLFSGEEIDILYKSIAKQLGKSKEDIIRAIEIINKEYGGDEISEIDYRYEEYMALLGNFDPEETSAGEFNINIQDTESYDIPGVENVVLVNRLRELRALIAFSRIKPLDRDDLGLSEDYLTHAIPIKRKKETDWFPAIEVRGEGIFITFKEETINQWINNNPEVVKRAEILNNRLNNSYQHRGLSPRKITPKFILLHTLSHLLIRELSFECGYSTASLRERLYCNETEQQPKMAGILIYTASGDSEGTLGGLVRQGKATFFNRIFRSAIKRAFWCSTDPLCIESHGQGTDALNMAACHACTLLPETSCEEFNRLLDRGLLIGTPENDFGFFSELIR